MNVTDLRQGLNLSSASKAASKPWPWPAIFLMTDEARLADPLAAIEALPSNSAVIVRHYSSPDRDGLARRVMAVAKRCGVRVLIAADARLAYQLGADGLHLPEAMAALGPGRWQLWRKPGWLVTAAAHSPLALVRAKAAGADAALLSPVFATASHPDQTALGPVRFASLCRRSPLPIYALGGMSGSNARRLKGCGGLGFAGISEIVNGG